MGFSAPDTDVLDQPQAGFLAPDHELIESPYFNLGDIASSVGHAFGDLKTTIPSSFYRMKEGLTRPDLQSESAKQAFAAEDALMQQRQAERESRQLEGTSSKIGETLEQGGQSLGFAVGSMAPQAIAGAGTGAAYGALGGPGGSTAGAIVGGAAGMLAGGASAYRQAGNQFLGDAFNHLEQESMAKRGTPLSEQEKADFYERLLPIAQNTGLWEAGPEAIGNAVTMGVGKYVFGFGKEAAEKLAGKALAKSLVKKGAAAAADLGVEIGGETITQKEQGFDQLKADAIARGEDPNSIPNPYEGWEGTKKAAGEVTPAVLGQMALMGLGAGAVKVGSKVLGTTKGSNQSTKEGSDVSEASPVRDNEEAIGTLPPLADENEELGNVATAEALRHVHETVPAQQAGEEAAETAVEAAKEAQKEADEIPAAPAAEEPEAAQPKEAQPATPVASDQQVEEAPTEREAEFLNQPPDGVTSSSRVTSLPEARDYHKQGGWKLHLSVKPENYKAVDEWLHKNHKGQYKLLSGGSPEEGSDFTIYVGHKDAANALAGKIESEIGGLVNDFKGGAVKDSAFNKKVGGRFDVSRTGPLKEVPWDYAGSAGIPLDREAMDAILHTGNKPTTPEEYAAKAAPHVARIQKELEKKYGERFSGKKSPTLQPNAQEQQAPSQSQEVPAGTQPEGQAVPDAATEPSQTPEAPSQAREDVASPHIRSMSVSGVEKTADLGPEGAAKFDALTEKSKGAGKARGHTLSAEKRKLHPDFQTDIEKAAEQKRLAGNYVGKPVSVDGRNGKVVRTSFGNVLVQFPDGTKRSVSGKKIEPPSESPTHFAKAEEPQKATAKNPFTYRLHSMLTKSSGGKQLFDGRALSEDGSIPKDIWNSRTSNLPKHEKALYESLVPEAFSEGKVNVRMLDDKLRDLPAVEVHSYGQDGGASKEKQEYDGLTHNWFDGLSQRVRNQVVNFMHGRLNESELKELGFGDEEIETAKRYTHLDKIVSHERPTGPRATSYYNSVSPLDTTKHPVKRIDVVAPYQDTVEVPSEVFGTALRHNDPLWTQDNLHENLPNTLGWAMVQETKDKSGAPVWLIGEMQSEWAKGKYKDSIGEKGYRGYTPDKDHPLLSSWESLVLKSVLDQARRAGVKKVVLSDGETAMMTEGHDKNINLQAHLPATENNIAKAKELIQTERNDQRRSVMLHKDLEQLANGQEVTLQFHSGDKLKFEQMGFDSENVTKPGQDSGMRAQYDKRGPDILRKLTGDSGEKVDLGVHKNGKPNTLEGLMDAGLGYAEAQHNLRLNPGGSPVFKDESGLFSKTNITGTEFSVPEESGPVHYAKAEDKKEEGDASIHRGRGESVPDGRGTGGAGIPFSVSKAGFEDMEEAGRIPFSVDEQGVVRPHQPAMDRIEAKGEASAKARIERLLERPGEVQTMDAIVGMYRIQSLEKGRYALEKELRSGGLSPKERAIREKSLDGVLAEMLKVRGVIKNVLSQAGYLLGSARIVVGEDFTKIGLTQRLEAAKGGPLNAADQKTVDELVKKDEEIRHGRMEWRSKEKTEATKFIRGASERNAQVWLKGSKKESIPDPSGYGLSVADIKNLLESRGIKGSSRIQIGNYKADPKEGGWIMKLVGGKLVINAKMIKDDDHFHETFNHELGHMASEDPEVKKHWDLLKKSLTKAEQKQIKGWVDKVDSKGKAFYSETQKPLEEAAELLRILGSRPSSKAKLKAFLEKITSFIYKVTGVKIGKADAELIAARAIRNAESQLKGTEVEHFAKGEGPDTGAEETEDPYKALEKAIWGEKDFRKAVERAGTVAGVRTKGQSDEEFYKEFNRLMDQSEFKNVQTADRERALHTAAANLFTTREQIVKEANRIKAQLESVSKDEQIMKRLQKRKADLERQVAAKQRDPKKSGSTREQSEEEKALREEVKALDRQLEKLAPRKTWSDRAKLRIANLEKRLREGNYVKTTKEYKQLTDEEHELKLQEDELRRKLWGKMHELRRENRPLLKRATDGLQDSVNLARSLMTSLDLSAVLRQGIIPTLANPIRSAKIIPQMLRAMMSTEAQDKIMRGIRKRPNAQDYEEGGLFLKDPSETSPSSMEEVFASRFIGKLPKWTLVGPAIRASERAYVSFLNLLRADVYDALKASSHPEGIMTHAEKKALAEATNTFTGRGKIGFSDKTSAGLNVLFFAPRYVASTFNALAGQPLYKGSAATRKAIAGEYARFLGGAALVYSLASMTFGDDDGVETDPRSSDFGKLRYGNTRLNPLGGLLQNTVLLSRVASGQTKTLGGEIRDLRGPNKKPGGDSVADILMRFARTKLSPVVSAAVDTASGEDVIGQSTDIVNETRELVTPLSLRDIAGAMEDQGIPRGTVLSILNLFGMGLQSFEPRVKK